MNEFHQTFIKRPVSKENTPTETKMKTEFQASECICNVTQMH